MNLARFPRRRYTHGPTPIEKLTRLSKELGGPQYLRQTRRSARAGPGGNKTRKLEFLVADALAQGADTLVTVGAVQSNHCRLTAAAAVREGLKCRLVLEERVPGSFDRLRGAITCSSGCSASRHPRPSRAAPIWRPRWEPSRAAQGRAAALPHPRRRLEPSRRARLRRLRGGASGPDVRSGVRVRASSSRAGVGHPRRSRHGSRRNTRRRPGHGDQRARGARRRRRSSTAWCRRSRRSGACRRPSRARRSSFDDYVGPGYSRPTAAMGEAVRLFARLEGVLLDPVYTGKAAAGLIDLARGVFRARRARRVRPHGWRRGALRVFRQRARLAARGESAAAFERRCIPSDDAARCMSSLASAMHCV